MKKKILALFVAGLLSVSAAAGCEAVQDEVQQQAEDEVNQQRTRAEERLQQEKTRALDEVRTTIEQGN